MKNLLLVLLSFMVVDIYAQCVVCTYTYDGTGSTNFNMNGSETLCITGNAGNLGINFNGSGNTVCIANGISWDQTNALNLSAGTTINVNDGTFTSSGMNFNGSGSLISVGGSGTLNWSSGNSNGNGDITINNAGTFNWTAAGDQTFTGLILVNSGTISKASGELHFGTGSDLTNSGTITVVNLENEEANTFNNTGSVTVSGHFYNHGAFTNANGGTLTTGSLRVGNKGPGKEFTNNGLVTVTGGDVRFEGPGINNGGIVLQAGSNLTVEKELTGTQGYVYLADGVSTISGGSFTGVQGFYDANNPSGTEEQFDNGNLANTSTAPITVLPLNLIYFKGQQLSNHIALSWKATDIINFNRFEIERSRDADSFERIGLQDLITNDIYNFIDNTPKEGQNYYRLKLLDLDGSINYSKIVSVNFEENAEYMFFENPAEGQRVVVNTNIKKPEVRILDLMGRDVNFKMNKTAEGFEITPKKYVYDILIISVNGEKNNFTKRAVLR